MNNRSQWNFPYAADKLLTAAIVKRDFHHGRQGWWQDKKEETIAKIRAEGIEIDESLAAEGAGTKWSNSGYARGASAMIRDDLLRDLTECVSKIKEHHGKAREYDGWVQVLESQGAASFNLHHEDWLFFFSKR